LDCSKSLEVTWDGHNRRCDSEAETDKLKQNQTHDIASHSPFFYRAFGIIQKFTIDRVMKKASLLIVTPNRQSRSMHYPEDFTLTSDIVEINADQILAIICSPARRLNLSAPNTPASSNYFHIHPAGCVPHVSTGSQQNHFNFPPSGLFQRSNFSKVLNPSWSTSTSGPLFGSCEDLKLTSDPETVETFECSEKSSRTISPVIQHEQKKLRLMDEEKEDGEVESSAEEKIAVAQVLLGFHKTPQIL
jgi:hypothetical protein